MSGAEFIVGAVLASVPITLDVYDRSGRVFEVFSIFRHYPREVLIFKTKLDVQRTIFRNKAVNLLTAITNDRPKVEDVVKQPLSESARHGLVIASAYRNRLDTLRESFESCRQIANHIRDCLELICSQYDEFDAEVGEKRDNMSYSDWLKHLKTRFKLGLQKPQICKAIEELRNLNRDFVLITDQITRALEEVVGQHRSASGGTVRRQVKSLNMLQKCHRGPEDAAATQQLATVLEESLGRFPVPVPTVALANQSEVSTSKTRRFFRIFRKGRSKENQQQAYGPSPLAQPAFHLPVLSEPHTRLQIHGPSGGGASVRNPAIAITSSDLTSTEDFCKSLNSASAARTLLKSFSVPHAQWFSVPQGPDTHQVQSLSDMVRWIAEEPILRSLPRHLLVDVASNIAEGIMQFYSTPWLASSDLGDTTASGGGKAAAERPSDYRAAEKLAQLLVNQMGLSYARVIKKCLGCDFGLEETDLENEDLLETATTDASVASASSSTVSDVLEGSLSEARGWKMMFDNALMEIDFAKSSVEMLMKQRKRYRELTKDGWKPIVVI
ncbi:hypothetical protein B0T16DRAFT_454520 [Cercophora newfieldiana]|uniref:Uncharacterized protein n=1 Tax=Cercophora newfieldiana TaxID=92897 RepID=A0AA40CWW0_9PEZI|nr:hypothetical protein B0T16DRAFT_454520 [Cercophora newfieldiana]